MIPYLANPELLPQDLAEVAWSHGLVISPYGSRIGVRTTSADLLREVRSRLLPGWQELFEPEADHLWSITDEAAFFDSQLFAGEPVREFDQNFHLYVGVTAVGYTFIHAAAVVFQGRGMLFPGSSYAGKSSLALAFHRAGATIYSDDLAVLDRQGLLTPYPKAISQRLAEGKIEEIAVPEWCRDLPPVPVTMIAGLRFQEDSPELRVEAISPGQASLMLLDNSLTGATKYSEDLTVIASICATAKNLKGIRGDADLAAGELLDMLSTDPGPPPDR